ncbi:MAG: hypothetical protein ABEI75_01370 [Halobaculum sp.]
MIRRVLTAAVAAAAVAVLAVAVGLALAPTATLGVLPAPERVLAASREFGGRIAVGVVGAALVSLAWRFAGSGGRIRTDDRLDTTRGPPPETVAVDPRTVAGGGIDERLARLAERGEPGAVGDLLRERAVAVERTTGVDRETARDRVARGAWTDDRLAAAVIGEETPVPVAARLRAWLDPAGETRRRVRHTLDALDDRLDGVEPTDGGEPDG